MIEEHCFAQSFTKRQKNNDSKPSKYKLNSLVEATHSMGVQIKSISYADYQMINLLKKLGKGNAAGDVRQNLQELSNMFSQETISTFLLE